MNTELKLGRSVAFQHLEYIEVNDIPKLASLKRLFPASYRSMAIRYRF